MSDLNISHTYNGYETDSIVYSDTDSGIKIGDKRYSRIVFEGPIENYDSVIGKVTLLPFSGAEKEITFSDFDALYRDDDYQGFDPRLIDGLKKLHDGAVNEASKISLKILQEVPGKLENGPITYKVSGTNGAVTRQVVTIHGGVDAEVGVQITVEAPAYSANYYVSYGSYGTRSERGQGLYVHGLSEYAKRVVELREVSRLERLKDEPACQCECGE